MELSGKVAIITGGSSGIGRAVSTLFAREGAKVLIGDINSEGGEETVKIIQEKGGTAAFMHADVRDSAQVHRLVEGALGKYGDIDVVCNVAGVELIKPMLDTTIDEWDLIMETNLRSIFLVSKCALPHLISKGNGVIVNISSQLGIVGWENWSAYCASKAAIILLTKVMALEYARYGIRVNCVCPGAIETPMVEREISHMQNMQPRRDPKSVKEEYYQDLIRKHPIGRIGKSEEIAHTVLFLATDRSSFILGQSIVADGGFVLS